MKRLALLLAFGGVAAVGCMAGAPSPQPLNPVRILLIGDLVGDSASAALADSGSLARAATVRKRIADQGRVLFVAAGNVLAARPGKRQTSVEMLNAAHIDYATPGPTELEAPVDTLARWIAASKFKWLSSNCTLPNAPDGARTAKLLSWDTVRISTHKVGIFGLTAPEPSHEPGRQNAPALHCGDPDSAASRVIDTLAAEGADLIVALTHQPTAKDRDLLLRESRLDLVLGGDEREPQTSAIAERHVLKAGAAARSVQFVTLWGGKDKWREAVGLVAVDGRLPVDTAVARAQKQIPTE